MIKYYLDLTDGLLAIAKATTLSTRQDKIDVHMYYSDFIYAPAVGVIRAITIYTDSWTHQWAELDTEGKKKIIRTKFE